MPSSESQAIVQRYVAAAQAGDADRVRELFADDATWTLNADLPIGGTWRGRDAIVGEFLATAMSHYRPEVREYMDTLYARTVAFSD